MILRTLFKNVLESCLDECSEWQYCLNVTEGVEHEDDFFKISLHLWTLIPGYVSMCKLILVNCQLSSLKIRWKFCLLS